MSLQCPCCRAANDAGPACRRCKADLSLLFALEGGRDRAIAAAYQFAAAGLLAEARGAAYRAAKLRRGPDTDRLIAVTELLNRDFAAAFAYYSAAGKSIPPADNRGRIET